MSVVRVIWRIGICVKSSLLVNGPQNNVRHGGECLNVLPNEESDTKKEGNTMHVLSRGHCMYRMYVKARTSSINKVSPALFLRSANNQLWHATFTFLCARLPDGGTRCSKIVPYRGLARIARKCPGARRTHTTVQVPEKVKQEAKIKEAKIVFLSFLHINYTAILP